MNSNGMQSTRYPRLLTGVLESSAQVAAERRVVRVWLGRHLIVSYENEPGAAASFERAMCRRYPSCRVTNDRVAHETSADSPSGGVRVE